MSRAVAHGAVAKRGGRARRTREAGGAGASPTLFSVVQATRFPLRLPPDLHASALDADTALDADAAAVGSGGRRRETWLRFRSPMQAYVYYFAAHCGDAATAALVLSGGSAPNQLTHRLRGVSRVDGATAVRTWEAARPRVAEAILRHALAQDDGLTRALRAARAAEAEAEAEAELAVGVAGADAVLRPTRPTEEERRAERALWADALGRARRRLG